MREIKVQLYKERLPESVRGVCLSAVKEEGSFMIIINALLPEAEQEKAFCHECLHIWRDDFRRPGANVQEIETHIHNFINHEKGAIL